MTTKTLSAEDFENLTIELIISFRRTPNEKIVEIIDSEYWQSMANDFTNFRILINGGKKGVLNFDALFKIAEEIGKELSPQ